MALDTTGQPTYASPMRHSLPTAFKTDTQCVAAILALHVLYRKDHKRAASVDLFASSFRGETTITVYADETPAHAAEVEWFKAQLTTLYP